MKLKHVIIVLSAVVFIWACAPRPSVTPGPTSGESGDELLSRAEKLFEARSYDEAMALYDEYYRKFEDKPSAAAALWAANRLRTTRMFLVSK